MLRSRVVNNRDWRDRRGILDIKQPERFRHLIWGKDDISRKQGDDGCDDQDHLRNRIENFENFTEHRSAPSK